MSAVSLRNTCLVETQWDVMENTDIKDVIVYRFEDEDDENGVPARPCGLHLRDPCAVGVIQGTETSPSDAPCSVTVSQTDQGHAISAIDALCSARFMELYSVHGDYICTSEGVRIDGEVEISGQDGQEKLYCLQHSFDVPMMSFILKFLGLTERSRLWVHSLHITITGQATSSGQSVASLMSSVMGTGVDWEKVRELTSDVHQEIPEKAHQLWDSVEAFQKKRESSVGPLGAGFGGASSAHGMPPMMAAMMSMFAGMNTTRQSGICPQAPRTHLHPGVRRGSDAASTSRDIGHNAVSVVMPTAGGNKIKRGSAMDGTVNELTTDNSGTGLTAGVTDIVNDLSYHGDVTHKFTSESAIQSDSASGLTNSAIFPRSSAGTSTIHHDSTNAPLNSADSASAPGDSASAPSSSLGVATTSCVHCIDKQTLDMAALEEMLKQCISEAEMRIVTVLGKRIDDAEQKTQEKLDAILRHLKQWPSPHNNVATNSSISLD